MTKCTKKKGKPVTKANPESVNVTPTPDSEGVPVGSSVQITLMSKELLDSGSELAGAITADGNIVADTEFKQRLTHWLNDFDRIGKLLLGHEIYGRLLVYNNLFKGILIGVHAVAVEEKCAEDPPEEYRERAYGMCTTFTDLCTELRAADTTKQCIELRPRVEQWCKDFNEHSMELRRTELWATLQRHFSAFDGWLCAMDSIQKYDTNDVPRVPDDVLKFVSDMEDSFMALTDRFGDIIDEESFKSLKNDVGEWTCRFGAIREYIIDVPGYESLEAHYNYLLGWRFATTQFKGSWEYPEGSCIPQLDSNTLGAKVVELTEVIEKLTAEKQTLMEEVECYRKGMDSFKSDIKLAESKHGLAKEVIKLLYTLYCSEG